MQNRSSLVITIFLMILLLFPNSNTAQAPSLPDEDDTVYLGRYWGAAGIADGLLEIVNSSILDIELNEKIEQLALNALDKTWEQRYTLENGSQIPAWSKYATAGIYPGQKYGAAGISINYMHAYLYTNNEKYLTWAQSSLDELLLEASNETEFPSWPYSYSEIRNPLGIPVSDISFGNLGVLDALLLMYEITNDTRYLDKSIEVYNWLDYISVPFESVTFSTKLIPWYTLGDDRGPLYTSLLSGNGAAIELFIKLGQYVDRVDITSWGIEIANAYVESQKLDGHWSIIFNKPESFGRTTLELGSAGIIYALARVGKMMNHSQYDNTIEKGINWLDSTINQSATEFFIPITEGESSGKYSLYGGLTGILKAIRISNMDQFSSILESGYHHLLNRVLYEGTIDGTPVRGFYPSTLKEPYTDLSLSDGLIGVAIELLDLHKSNPEVLNMDNIKLILTSISNTYLVFQNENGLWSKQILIDPLYATDSNGDIFEPSSNTKDSISYVLLDFVILFILISLRSFTKKKYSTY
ncbi:MAG: hypothetical protein HeimC2_32640 [Candidatus Heimdallarchaeota archaeon LC_2]|nr:MAG: hypothetical protein HeimC2_32640 [Candidatus Heimdallarchaeota archaeon LC_2]